MFGFGKSKEKKIDTPIGPACVRDGFVEILYWRYRGVFVEVAWPDGVPAPVLKLSEIRADFDRLTQLGLTFLGVDEFPAELRTIVAERVEFGREDDYWTLVFRCPESPDSWWAVDFKGERPLVIRHGD